MAISRKFFNEFYCIEKGAALVLLNKDHKYQKNLKDKNFILYHAYLSGIFWVMNLFNCYLQLPESNIIDFETKLTAFSRKLHLWIKNIQNRLFGIFEIMALFGREPSFVER